jgi:tRNA-2-methylthio-N6-dimethylallyladenosine synthase
MKEENDPRLLRSFFVQTFGCQMNVNDSERLAGLLRSRGLEPAGTAEEADFVFLNTCAVREKATAKFRHALGRLRRLKNDRPGLRVGVGGCVPQLEGESAIGRAKHVDVLVGTHTLHRIPELLGEAAATGKTAVDLDRKADAFAIPGQIAAHANPVRAYVTVMEGCNHVCSFCVVPRTRGPEVNRPPSDVVREVEAAVAQGFGEVMLLGQTVNAYRHADTDFAGLLERVDQVAGLRRLRFTTSHPEHVSARMADAFRRLPRVCPYLHLPFQSGSDRVLASMRRGYTRQQYLDTIALLRDRVPDMALSTDVIVGYPGETEAEFEETLSVLETVGFESLFAFSYSPRPGTTALRLVDDVPEEEKRRRLHVVNAHQQQWQRRRHEARVGGVEEVLVESVDGEGRVSGRSRHFRIVHLNGEASLVGHTVLAEITAAGPNSLQAGLLQAIH